jgi:hypothetical protein
LNSRSGKFNPANGECFADRNNFLFSFSGIRHRYRTNCRLAIVYDLDLGDASKLLKGMTKVRFGDGKRNISNLAFHGVIGLYVIASARVVPGYRVSNGR